MKIESIEIENFRQYENKQLIQFATDEKNVTVILGENGRGKTGIFRALIFCLFGDTLLSQDSKKTKTNRDDMFHLVNINKLNNNIDSSCEAIVKVAFISNNQKYIITRSIKEMKTSKNEFKRENKSKVILETFDENGNFKEPIESEEKIGIFINEIINNDLKEFFFFDGQHLIELTDASKDSKDKIKDGILKLLQIDKLDKAILIIRDLKNEQGNKTKSTNTKYNSEKLKLDELYGKKNIKDFELEQKKLEIEKAKSERSSIEIELKKNEIVKRLYSKRELEIGVKNQEEKNLENIKKNIKKFIKGSSQGEEITLLTDSAIIKLKNYLELDEVREEYIPNLSVNLINEILQNKQCICGTYVGENSKEFKVLEEIMNKLKKTSMSDFVQELNFNIKEYYQNRDRNIKNIEEYLEEREEIIDKIDDIQNRINDLNREIKLTSQNEENLKEKENTKSKLENSINNLEMDIKLINKELENLDKDILETKKNVEIYGEEEAKNNLEVSKLRILENLEESFKKIYSAYSDKMREKLSHVTTDLFKKLIDESDRQLLKEIKINEKYEITALGWSGDSILWDLSAGQKHIVSLAFVTALAKVAAGENKIINLPLFIDTPFGNISGNNRDNLLTALPKLASQLILLVTDTEFTRAEIDMLTSTNKWGKFFKINKLEQGTSTINEIIDMETYLGRR